MIQTTKQEKLGTLLALIFKLQDETSFPDQKQRQEALNKLIIYAQQIGLSLDPDDPEFLPTLLIKILEESTKPTELPPGNLPPQELTEIYEKEKQEKEAQIQEAIGSPKAYSDYHNYIELFKQWVLKNKPQLPDQLATAIAEESAQKTIVSLEPIAQPNVLSEEDKNKILEQAEKIVKDELKKIEFEDKTVIQGTEKITTKKPQKIPGIQLPIIPEEFRETIKAQSIKIAASPQIIRPLQETVRTKTIPYREIPLSDNIIKKLEQPPEEITFLPLYTLLHPKVLTTWIEKKLYTIPAKILKIGTEEATSEWQAMAQQGLFTEDYQSSIETLKDWGASIDHPLIKKLEDKAEHFKEQQKIPYKIKKGISLIQSWRDTAAAKILKHYYHFDKITGRHKIYDKDLKANLPKLSPDLVWSQGGYAGFLRNTLSHFRFVIRSYEKISKFVTKGKYTSILIPVRNFFSQKITQPVIRWLAKTAAGKAVKAGAKKAAVWAATKLGIKIGVKVGVAAAGAATGPPGWVVAAITIGLDILKALSKKIFGFIRKIIQDPEKALGSVGLGVLLLVFVPMPIALIGILPITIGGIGLVSFTLAPATLTTIGGGIGAFFTAIATLPFTLPIALFVIILLSVLAGLTLFIVLVVSGAFILPSKVAEVTPITISPYESEYFSVTKSATPDKLDNSDLEKTPPPSIEYTVKIKAKKDSNGNDYKLTINSITETVSLSYDQKSGKQLSVSPHSFEKDLDEIEHINVASWETKYKIYLFPGFENTAIINTITAEITIEGITGTHPAVASAIVIIGNPPVDCPSGYPTDHGVITQGPFGGYSHRYGSIHDPYGPNQIAIDISGPGFSGYVPVRATHNGNLQQASCGTSGCGIFIYSPCAGVKNFYTAYWHLKDSGRRPNGPVSKGNIIGYTNGWQNHLHYEFGPPGPKEWPTTWKAPIEMKPRYFPQTVPYECSGNCGISW